MNDVELAALAALVSAMAGLPGYGVVSEPDWASMDALRAELLRRGVVPTPTPPSTETR